MVSLNIQIWGRCPIPDGFDTFAYQFSFFFFNEQDCCDTIFLLTLVIGSWE